MEFDLFTALLGGHPGLLTAALLAIGIASIADALLPVPAPTSPWYRARKALSAIAANVKHARNAALAGPVTALTGVAGAAAVVGSLVRAGAADAVPDAAEAWAPGQTHGEALLALVSRLEPADPAGYAATMAQIAAVAGRAAGTAAPTS